MRQGPAVQQLSDGCSDGAAVPAWGGAAPNRGLEGCNSSSHTPCICRWRSCSHLQFEPLLKLREVCKLAAAPGGIRVPCYPAQENTGRPVCGRWRVRHRRHYPSLAGAASRSEQGGTVTAMQMNMLQQAEGDTERMPLPSVHGWLLARRGPEARRRGFHRGTSPHCVLAASSVAGNLCFRCFRCSTAHRPGSDLGAG